MNQKGSAILSLPVSINFFEMGKAVYNLITGSRQLNYKFNGSLDMSSSLHLLKDIHLPVEKTGTVDILR